MYYSFYGLKENPFKIVPDHRFLYLSETHKEALAALVYGLEEGHTFLLLTGEVGTGKTIVLESFRINIDKNIRVMVISNPKITVEDFFYSLARRFNLEANSFNKIKVLEHLEMISDKTIANTHHTLLIVDEAQTLSRDLIEEIRLLSNIPSSVLQIFLVGQPELKELLSHREFTSLDQRIGIRCQLRSMDHRETQDYIEHRLKIAGATNYRSIFRQDAFDLIFNYTRGVPRVINNLCDQILITGFSKNVRTIPAYIVKQTIKELDYDGFGHHSKIEKNKFYKLFFTEIKPISIIGRFILLCILIILIVILCWELIFLKHTAPLIYTANLPFVAPAISQNAETAGQTAVSKNNAQDPLPAPIDSPPIKEKNSNTPSVTSIIVSMPIETSIKDEPKQQTSAAPMSQIQADFADNLPMRNGNVSNQTELSLTLSRSPEITIKDEPKQDAATTILSEKLSAPDQRALHKYQTDHVSAPLPVDSFVETVKIKQGDTFGKLITIHYGQFNDAIFRKVTASNPHIKNPDIIHPGEKLNFPQISNDINSVQ
jgi:general secretion pathway protein A